MTKETQRNPLKRILIDIAGFGLMIAAPLLGWLPGPGGIPIFVAGLALVATNHVWAETLLKDFDDKRIYYTNKFLHGSRLVSGLIDLTCIGLISSGLYLSFTQEKIIFRGLSLAMMSFGIIILLSNQKRLDRIIASFRKKS